MTTKQSIIEFKLKQAEKYLSLGNFQFADNSLCLALEFDAYDDLKPYIPRMTRIYNSIVAQQQAAENDVNLDI